MTLFRSSKKNSTRGVTTDSAVSGGGRNIENTEQAASHIVASSDDHIFEPLDADMRNVDTVYPTEDTGPEADYDNFRLSAMFLKDGHGIKIDDSYFQLYQLSGARPLPSSQSQDDQYLGSRSVDEGGRIIHGGSHTRTGAGKHGARGRLISKIESAKSSMLKGPGTWLRRGNSEPNSTTLQGTEHAEATVHHERTVAHMHRADPANEVPGAGNPPWV